MPERSDRRWRVTAPNQVLGFIVAVFVAVFPTVSAFRSPGASNNIAGLCVYVAIWWAVASLLIALAQRPYLALDATTVRVRNLGREKSFPLTAVASVGRGAFGVLVTFDDGRRVTAFAAGTRGDRPLDIIIAIEDAARDAKGGEAPARR